MQGNKKAFTLVELLVAMAIIAILLGLSVVGITIVQQNARDTQRRSMVNSIEITLNSMIAAGNSVPSTFSGGAANTLTATNFQTINLVAPLVRNATNPFVAGPTSAAITNYCYGGTGSIYVVGVELEGGGFFSKTNSGGTFTAVGGTSNGVTCTDTAM